jgi:predicted RNA-binding Zn ribbon-like protein
MPLLLVQAFINTLDIAEGTDLLRDPEAAAGWLSAAGLIAPGVEPSTAELRDARAVREGLRALVRRSGGGAALAAEELGALRTVADRRRPVVAVEEGGRVSLGVGGDTDIQDGLLVLLLIIRDAQADGTWARLKLCANPECAWAFYDRSRNRQGAWCTMAACGNRLKNRRFRARGHQPEPGP